VPARVAPAPHQAAPSPWRLNHRSPARSCTGRGPLPRRGNGSRALGCASRPGPRDRTGRCDWRSRRARRASLHNSSLASPLATAPPCVKAVRGRATSTCAGSPPRSGGASRRRPSGRNGSWCGFRVPDQPRDRKNRDGVRVPAGVAVVEGERDRLRGQAPGAVGGVGRGWGRRAWERWCSHPRGAQPAGGSRGARRSRGGRPERLTSKGQARELPRFAKPGDEAYRLCPASW
jgi:hypothetical protein